LTAKHSGLGCGVGGLIGKVDDERAHRLFPWCGTRVGPSSSTATLTWWEDLGTSAVWRGLTKGSPEENNV